MQSAATVLGVLRERGRRGLPCDELYRQLFNPQLYLLAYGRIYANHGAMTPGVTPETVDGMSQRKIDRIIEAMRHERYRFRPVRRVHIPKKNGSTRPLGLPTWSDKLVGEVVRLLLEAYYEPTFSDRSHGFRPRRGCHTALREVAHTWTGTSWFVEGDIADCFGSLDHQVLLSILGEKIHDQRFLRLVRNMLTAGYMEDWKWGATLSGAPQGGVASPILSNIYLHKLDEFVEKVLIPEYTYGERRARNPAYLELQNLLAKARRRGDRPQARTLRQRMTGLPSADPNDPEYRRLRYVRYADDHLLGFTGPKAEAEQIKRRLAEFLRDELKLELSQEKTLITHARTRAARFLGYEVTTQHNDTKKTGRYRRVNGQIALRVPRDVIKAKCEPYLARGKPAKRTELTNGSDHAIVATFGAVYRGIVQYYLLAGDVFRLHRLQWVMETSMLKTLAGKHRSTVSKMAAKHKARIDTPNGPRVCFEARIERTNRKPLVARFGGIPLQQQRSAKITDRRPVWVDYPQKELITRLLADTCEICGATGDVQVHHVRALADLARAGWPPSDWARVMLDRRRKTLVACTACHDRIHKERTSRSLTS
ncbi:reverse transcriptase domain-containing protein [Kitasatospora purpeofusca]|uniref:reverse transcriptase/maturase family protein n=1 Tax=Kitasatospora purpeofusca TaxID=67352 RepID=UPI00224FA700|nr:reverse transcriptase/maturase family protein [Kitasatospora purpeofusca]MCX4684017.1 reverse transcriptase domain-containing protein [Kitasatospora purpeofusca]MCX4690264.1 reverse transcriptase domain-containing protein [Kitasatospora purpeofusca]